MKIIEKIDSFDYSFVKESIHRLLTSVNITLTKDQLKVFQGLDGNLQSGHPNDEIDHNDEDLDLR